MNNIIKVMVRDNVKSKQLSVSDSDTVRSALEAAEVDYAAPGTSTTMDGATLLPGMMDKTFAELGITEKCYLMSIRKTDNA
jgi:hypothetical protein